MRSRTPTTRSVVVALAAAIAAGGCAAGDDVIRAASRYAHNLGPAKRLGDDIARALASSNRTAVTRSARRVESVSDRSEVPAEIRPAFLKLIWDVGCDVVSGGVQPTADSVARMLASRAASFGLEFTADGVKAVGGALLDAFGRGIGTERSDAAEACSRLRDSGL